MKHKLFSNTAPLLAVGLTTVALLAGCGGGGNNDSGGRDANGFVTRAEEGKYSTDALVLASRETSEAPIPTATANAVEADLTAVRARYTQLADIHATPTDDLKSVLVTVTPGSPVASVWGQGQVRTSIPTLDSQLATYKASDVNKIYSGKSSSIFVVHFTDPLNTAKVRETLDNLTGTDAGLVSVEPNTLIGDGDQITRTASGNNRVYTFSHGFGDCAAGCISRHTWTVTLSADGAASLAESGTPLPGG